MGIIAHSCNLSTWEEDVGGSDIQDQPLLKHQDIHKIWVDKFQSMAKQTKKTQNFVRY